MVIRILHPYIWAYQSPPAISSSSLLFHVKKCFFYFLFYFLFLSLYLEVVLEDYNNDRARVLKKVLLPLLFHLFVDVLVDKKQTLLLCFIYWPLSSLVHSSPSFAARDACWYTPSALPDSFGAGAEEPECRNFPCTFLWNLHHQVSARAPSSVL